MYACSTGVEEEGEDGTKGPDGCCMMCICININVYVEVVWQVVYSTYSRGCSFIAGSRSRVMMVPAGFLMFSHTVSKVFRQRIYVRIKP